MFYSSRQMLYFCSFAALMILTNFLQQPCTCGHFILRDCGQELVPKNTVPKEKKNERKLRHISKHCYLKRCKFRNSVHASSTRTSTLQMKVAHKIDVVPTYTAKPVPQKTLKHRLPRLVYYNITLILLPLLLALLTDFTQIPLKGKILLTEK